MPTATGKPRRVLVVDDQLAFAQSLELVIDAQDGLECIGTAASGEEALARVAAEAPAVVVMDVRLPDIDGIEATRRIRQADAGVDVVVLTGVPDASVLARAASAGACAFLLKDSSVSEIIDALRSDRGPTMGVGSTALMHLVGGSAEDSGLTRRELEVLGMLAEGHQPKQIAHEIGITVNTCRGYVKNILAKLEVHSALAAVVEAHRRGLICLDA